MGVAVDGISVIGKSGPRRIMTEKEIFEYLGKQALQSQELILDRGSGRYYGSIDIEEIVLTALRHWYRMNYPTALTSR